MTKRQDSLMFLAFSAALFCVAGCEPKKDPLVEKAKSEILSVELAGEPISIEQAIAKSSESESPSETVIIRAKIGSGKGDTFEPASSAFLVSEVPEGEHANEVAHDADNCPFCRAREAKAPTVVVRLVGKDGQPFSKSADQLLGLKKGQHVLIRGEGSFDSELNFFTIKADGLKLLN